MFKQYKDTPYDIYNDGRCYSHLSNKFLTPKMSVTYPTYNLTINNKKRQIKVHRMVAETFLPNPNNKPIVHHIDGDTHNFNLNNLEWVTEKENSQKKVNEKKVFFINDNFNFKEEEWIPIKDYPNYIISSIGHVMNLHSKHLLKPYQDNSGGYLVVNLWKNNQNKLKRIHTLVYSNFYNDYDLEGFVINHKDGNKLNNNIENLEKITYTQNSVYIIKTNKSNKEVIQLDNDKNEIAIFPSIARAQQQLHISNISRAIKKQGKAGGYYWKFK